MSIVDDLVANLVERNVVRLNGAFSIAFIDGGFKIKGHVFSTLLDQKKKTIKLDVVR